MLRTNATVYLKYPVSGSRPKTFYAVFTFKKFVENFCAFHWTSIKRILCYGKRAALSRICYRKNTVQEPAKYFNSDWAGYFGQIELTRGMAVMMAGAAVSLHFDNRKLLGCQQLKQCKSLFSVTLLRWSGLENF